MSNYSLDLDALPIEPDWDSYGGQPTTEAAKATAAKLWAVPCSDGGIQIELHAGGADIEIEISPEGYVASVFWKPGPL